MILIFSKMEKVMGGTGQLTIAVLDPKTPANSLIKEIVKGTAP
ncbi:hypothetical protein [Roseibium sediminicola]|nr:hypothetical protein [Roseibium sp. CAU 1639]